MPDPIKTPLHPVKPVPVGTKVRYHGSHPDYHGEYTIARIYDAEALAAAGRAVEHYGKDNVGYELMPDYASPYRGWQDGLHFVRRTSFTVIEDEQDEPVTVTKDLLDDFRDIFLNDPDFTHSVGTINIAKFAAIFDLAEKSLIREADSGV
jgi:hypothetical protein